MLSSSAGLFGHRQVNRPWQKTVLIYVLSHTFYVQLLEQYESWLQLLEIHKIMTRLAMAKLCLNVFLLLETSFLGLKTRNQIYMIAGEQGERENAWSKTKGKWPFVSVSSTEQVENPKYPLKRKGKRCVVCLLYCLNILMLMNPRWQAVQIIHEWIDCLRPFNTREASAQKLTISCNLQRPINTLAKIKIRRHFT